MTTKRTLSRKAADTRRNTARGNRRTVQLSRQEQVLAVLRGGRKVTLDKIVEDTRLKEVQVRAGIDRLRRAGYHVPRVAIRTVQLQTTAS